MCGIVGYFGGAGNNLTRILTAMSAIIYRAPDSTGVGVFGDDLEPLRTRKALGSAAQLIPVLRENPLYANAAAELAAIWHRPATAADWRKMQKQVLQWEGLAAPDDLPLLQGEAAPVSFDALLDLEEAPAITIGPGYPGNPCSPPTHFIRSPQELQELIGRLIKSYDLSPVAIQTLIRSALADTLAIHSRGLEMEPAEILAAFDSLFEATLWGNHSPQPALSEYDPPLQEPMARHHAWRYLAETPLDIPSDYDRDGVRCLFRLLDAAFMCRLPHAPELADAVQEIFQALCPHLTTPRPADWRMIYRAEKGANVYGWAAAAVLTYLQKEELWPALSRDISEDDLMEGLMVPGRTDPVCLRFLATPIISQGRWALQSPVTIKNAHPFCDWEKGRMIVLNGQFESENEGRLREFLQRVAGVSFRSRNSSEYLALLWGYYAQQLNQEKKRFEGVRAQIERGLEAYSVGSQAVDYQVYHRVRDRSLAELDESAFLDAVRQMVRGGGQLAACGISHTSPSTLYVASHNRPVFIVQRPDTDDFMVVSDINAAMGLFPQELIHRKTLALHALRQEQSRKMKRLKASGRPRQEAQEVENGFQEKENELLATFQVRVYPLEGEEVFARMGVRFRGGKLERQVTITDFEGHPADIEPFVTVLTPPQIQKDFYGSFYETHLHEIPERLGHIRNFYLPEENAPPRFDIQEGRLKRRFGKHFGGLKRLVLAGMGSSFHMGRAAKAIFHHLIPELEVAVVRPSEIDQLEGAIVPDRDLVLLLSWSATTADMVQLARRLKDHRALMVGVTEKIFADMALVAQKSGGVVPVLSGEEVTVSSIKSTVSTLYCLALFAGWLACRMGWEAHAFPFLRALAGVPDAVQELLQDEELARLARETAAGGAHSRSVSVVDALYDNSVAAEAALKIEENSWTTIGRPMDYGEVAWPALTLPGNFTLVGATLKSRFAEAFSLMERLAGDGLPFVAVTYPTRELSRIQMLAKDGTLVLPKLSDELQPFIDLVFYYLFAFHYGLAHGRSGADFPRNRAKSVTAGRTFPQKPVTPAREVRAMEEINRGALAEGRAFVKPTRPSPWEGRAAFAWEKAFYQEMRRLAGILQQDTPLAALVHAGPAELARVGGRLMEAFKEEGQVVLIPGDRPAAAAARDFCARWKRILGLSLRAALPGEPLSHFTSDALFIFLAAPDQDPAAAARELEKRSLAGIWIGGKAPKDVASRFLGVFPFKPGTAIGRGSFFYAALAALFIDMQRQWNPAKSDVMAAHLGLGGLAIRQVLADRGLKEKIDALWEANRSYRTALLAVPPGGTGMAFKHLFDWTGALALEWYPFGESAHGSLVTVDPRVEKKFVRLEAGAAMAAQYGPEKVAAWERRYLKGQTVDAFLARTRRPVPLQAETPFYAAGNWYFPVLQRDYDAAEDNLVIIDATSPRYFGQALDELATFGCRYPRMAVISQAAFTGADEKHALFQNPISHFLPLPPLAASPQVAPISDHLLPFASPLLAMAMAAAVRKLAADGE